MVKSHGIRQMALAKDLGSGRIVARFWQSCPLSNKNRRNGVAARVPSRVGINMKLPEPLNLSTGFLFGLPRCCLFQRLAVIHKSARDRPTRWLIFPADQDNPFLPDLILDFDDNIYGGNRIEVLNHRSATFRTKNIFGFHRPPQRKIPNSKIHIPLALWGNFITTFVETRGSGRNAPEASAGFPFPREDPRVFPPQEAEGGFPAPPAEKSAPCIPAGRPGPPTMACFGPCAPFFSKG